MTVAARIAVVMVNYGAADFIIAHMAKTLAAIEPFENATVYIIDNASPGGDDLLKLQAYADQPEAQGRVVVIDSGANLGFAGGNNCAFKTFGEARPDYVFFLNPDAYPEPDAVTLLAETLAKNPDAAIAAPRILNEAGETEISYFQFPSVLSQFSSESELSLFQDRTGWRVLDLDAAPETVETDWVSGAAFLLRMDAADAPPMDDGYFLYFEETDMMRSLSEKKWRTLLAPRAAVTHIGGLTTGADADAKRLPSHWYASWRRYFVKHFGRSGAIAAAALKLSGYGAYRIKLALHGAKPRRPEYYMSDFLRYAVWPILTKGRD
ncbi:MAG: glycosyltransferase family 2 protein [Pseudomonadota bacterium]